jgi:hypothetical protein
MADEDLLRWAVEEGLIRRNLDGFFCPKCGGDILQVHKSKSGGGLVWQCKMRGCGKLVALTANDSDLFLARVPLKKQIIALYFLCTIKQPGAALVAEMLHLDEHTVNDLFNKARAMITAEMRIANRFLSIGGRDLDVELDEICFRNSDAQDSDGNESTLWYRFLGAVRRGSSFMYVGVLPVKFVKG